MLDNRENMLYDVYTCLGDLPSMLIKGKYYGN